MKKLISVIIPAYNVEKTIERAIKSINSRDVEIIIVVDGSKDNTLEVCKNIKQNNIQIIEQENKGPFESRKIGINKANGKYVMFLDADDMFENNTIDRIKEIIKKYNNPDLIRFRYKKIPNGYEQFKYFEENEKIVLKDQFKKSVYPMFIDGYMLNALWTNCIKTEYVKNCNIKLDVRYGEDLLLNLDIFSKINNVVFLNDILYQYTYQEDSLTNSKSLNRLFRNLENSIYVYTQLHRYIELWGMRTEENIEKINNRIIKESKQIIEIIKK